MEQSIVKVDLDESVIKMTYLIVKIHQCWCEIKNKKIKQLMLSFFL